MDQIENFEWATRKACGKTTIWIRFARGLYCTRRQQGFLKAAVAPAPKNKTVPGPRGQRLRDIPDCNHFPFMDPCSNDPHPHAEMRRASNQISCKKMPRLDCRNQTSLDVSEARVMKAQRLLAAAVSTWGVAGAGSDLVGGVPGSAGIGLTAGHCEIPWFGHFAIAPYRVRARHLTIHRTARLPPIAASEHAPVLGERRRGGSDEKKCYGAERFDFSHLSFSSLVWHRTCTLRVNASLNLRFLKQPALNVPNNLCRLSLLSRINA
jgi:hypothetical protein